MRKVYTRLSKHAREAMKMQQAAHFLWDYFSHQPELPGTSNSLWTRDPFRRYPGTCSISSFLSVDTSSKDRNGAESQQDQWMRYFLIHDLRHADEKRNSTLLMWQKYGSGREHTQVCESSQQEKHLLAQEGQRHVLHAKHRPQNTPAVTAGGYKWSLNA